MLKIGSVSWKGRCAAHPDYNPAIEGEEGIRNGCRRCYALFDIYEQHRGLTRALREFGAARGRKPRANQTPLMERQQTLFE